MRTASALRIGFLGAVTLLTAWGQTSTEHWVVTWATSAQIYRAPAPPAPPTATPPPAANPNVPARPRAPREFNNQTVRMVVHTSIGGKRLRLQLTNPFGGAPVQVGAAHVALRDKESSIIAGSDRVLTVAGSKTFRMIPGETLISDPVDLEFAPLADLAVSLYFPASTGPLASHGLGLHTTYISGEGDFTAQAAIPEPTTTAAYYWISAIDVVAPAEAAAIVTLGDSITDGAASTVNQDRMWPARLASRLQANKATANIAVANEGISGNRILMDGSGVAALARLDHDVLLQTGAKWVMFLEGINDIGNQVNANTGLTSADLIAAMRQIVDRAHLAGLKVIGCTLTPYDGAKYYSEAGEVMREAENEFIRSGGVFDAVVDFDAAVRDPMNPKRYRTEMQSGDNLHPSDAGYQAMADAIDLGIFAGEEVTVRRAMVALFAIPLFAQPPVPRYEVKRATSPIVIDGKVDDKAWAAANKVELIFPWDAQTGDKQKTTARLLWDDNYLYVSYECEDTDIVATHTEHDDPTYLDDAVEIFINPMPSQTSVYYGLEMNVRAVLYDYVMYQPGGHLFKQFDLRGVQLATFIDGTLNMRGDKDKGWSLEVAIPWANFEGLAQRPTPGTIWTANINRWDGVEPNRRMSNWSNPLQPAPNPHVPARFGQLVFVR